jgi:4-hydroxy-2-oxoheptanedioate aldolase
MTVGRPAVAQEQTRLNRTIQTLEQGQAVFGAFIGDFSPFNARYLSRSGLDFIFIDMEHNPWDAETLRAFLYGLNDRGATGAAEPRQLAVTPIVRIPQNGREMQQFYAKQALDIGIFGIIFPFVDDREETLNAVSSMRYPRPRGSPILEPRGTRGRYGGVGWYWGLTPPEYFERSDVWPLNSRGELLAVIQIETPEGVANIEEIITVPGVGAIFVGPLDLATQMGYGDQTTHPDVEAAIQTVLQSCLRHDVPCGITTGPADIAARTRQGFRFTTVGNDGGLPPTTVEALGIGRATAGRQ